ncbi:SDR family NAD(P)-dependent oxidoreductase [Undibacter mobilis]|uniref:SDR family NAD(P)-dependent oxidoreductase n=1 Tax=Undibacter mobilis TaxID=2292256 RepID=A0A371BBC2_9BRAD|nr:SDR family NAD(P)-dependent oxidoreductase [Undibacter mobilis]RDV04703.1 SDR family NAD(P)-dependent oxidoreductase [Undibacter mobilis]
MDLTGKVAIVTGAARGIGLAVATRFCRAGARVVIADLNANDTDNAIKTVQRDLPGAQCLGVTVDVGDRPSVEAMVEKTVAAFGRVDILVSNAGVWKNLSRGPFWQLSNAEWQNTFRVNTEGAFNCASAVAPHLVRQKSGRIIFIGSAAIGEALAHITQYSASKSALIGLMRCAAKELGKDGITVNMVNPGQVDTGAFTREQLESRAQSKFIHRVGVPQDLEGIITLLASDEAALITAQQIFVDGGGVMN